MGGYIGKRKKEHWCKGFLASVLLSLVETREKNTEGRDLFRSLYTLQSSWGIVTSNKDLLNAGYTHNMVDEGQEREFTPDHELVGLYEKDNPKASDPYTSDVRGLYGSEVGPYETLTISYHVGEYRSMIDLGATVDQALDWAVYFQSLAIARENSKSYYWLARYEQAKEKANKEVGSDSSLRAASHYHRASLLFWPRKSAKMRKEWESIKPSEPTQVGFEAVCEDREEMVDLTLSPMERERAGHLEEQARQDALIDSPMDEKRMWGQLDHTVNFRAKRYAWLYRYFLSCQTKEEIRIARSRLIESIDRNNTMCRKAQMRGNKEAWVAAILNPNQKRSLMKLANELLRERTLTPACRPPASEKPWMP